MAVFKCKMCGGNLEIAEGTTLCECEYCGTKQTLPKSSDEQQLNLINRANHFRQQCEFDKAMEIYERMLQRDDSDAEIYWSIVLCRYGIEYVDDPATGKKIPTCHRAQFTLITQDADYLEALSHADAIQKEVYQSEAEYIANVQKGILEISNKEDPFDVFICYKETDENGQRTQDSVLAQELYYQLTQEGFKVFFSRITLEDKLGSAYEPYIFAALNSSKVMVVVGTKPEYFNAVWVKNEWSRYLLLMKEDHSKTLIPAYKGMDPYDLPDALSMFQAQDMSKLGFMQDLIRGIKKIAGSSKESAPQSSRSDSRPVNSKADNLVKRGFMSLEDGDMQKAGSYFEQALNENAEEARAYEGLLLVELNVRNEADLGDLPETFDDRNNYKKAIRFADDQLRERLSGYNEAIRNHILDNAYESAKTQLENAYSFDDVKAGVTCLLQVKGRGSANDILFDTACKYSEDTNLERLNLALLILKEIPDHPGAEDIIYKMGTRFEEETDAEKLSFCVSALEIISDRDGVAEKITALKAIISDIEARTAEKKKHDYDEKINKWRSDFADGLVELNLESYAMDLNDCYRYKINYKEGKRLIAASGYDKDHYFENKAENIVNAISNLIDDTNRTLGEKRRRYAFAAGGSFILSLVLFIVAFSIGFQDKYNSITYNTMTLFMVLASVVLVLGVVFALIRNSCQVDVKDFLSYTKYVNAWKELQKAIETDAFHDSELKELYEIRKSEKSNAKRTGGSSGSKKNADRKKSSGAVGVVIIIVCIIGGIVGGVLFFTHFLPSNKYNDAIALMNNGSYEEAITLFTELGKYKDSRSLIAQCHQLIVEVENTKKYDNAIALMNNERYEEAIALFTELGEYKDSSSLIAQCDQLIVERDKLLEATKIIDCNVGDIITIGSYEQDNNLGNGAEPIEWQVLDVKDGKALVISKYVIDRKLLDDRQGTLEARWSECTLRTWLNKTFINTAFSEIEKSRIKETLVRADKNPRFPDVDTGVNVRDKIFLLSMEEAVEYFPNGHLTNSDFEYYIADSLIAYDTAYAFEVDNPDGKPMTNTGDSWWLRTIGSGRSYASIIGYQGAAFPIGWGSNYLLHGVRPVMWYIVDPEEAAKHTGISLDEAEPGDIITFGSYEQDNDLSNGAEPIEWVVLESDDHSVRVISKNILDAVPYHKYNEYVLWQDSSIHAWLNNDFYNTAFSAEEKDKIRTTGEIVQDSLMKLWSDVVLLNLNDILAYYGGQTYYNMNEEYYQSSKLKAKATPYALANGCDDGCWWLEDIGMSQWGYSAVSVRSDGTVADMGIKTSFCGVRPVIVINR